MMQTPPVAKRCPMCGQPLPGNGFIREGCPTCGQLLKDGMTGHMGPRCPMCEQLLPQEDAFGKMKMCPMCKRMVMKDGTFVPTVAPDPYGRFFEKAKLEQSGGAGEHGHHVGSPLWGNTIPHRVISEEFIRRIEEEEAVEALLRQVEDEEIARRREFPSALRVMMAGHHEFKVAMFAIARDFARRTFHEEVVRDLAGHLPHDELHVLIIERLTKCELHRFEFFRVVMEHITHFDEVRVEFLKHLEMITER